MKYRRLMLLGLIIGFSLTSFYFPLGFESNQGVSMTPNRLQSSNRFLEEWNRTSGGPEGETGAGMSVSENYVYTMCNFFSSSPYERHVRIQKWNKITGDLIWNITWVGYDEDYGYCVWGNDSSVYFAGLTNPTGSTNPVDYQSYIVRLNSEGGLIWQQFWDGPGEDRFHDIWGNKDGSAIFTYGVDDSSGKNILLVRWDAQGQEIWNTTWDNNIMDYGLKVWGDEDFIYGTGVSGIAFNDHNQLLLMKWDMGGNKIWNRTWGENDLQDYAYGIHGTNENIYTSGFSLNMSSSKRDTILVKWDKAGNQIWNRTWNHTTTNYANSVWASNDFIYTGGAIGEGYNGNPLMIKWSPQGNVLCTNNYTTTENGAIAQIYSDHPSYSSLYTLGSVFIGSGLGAHYDLILTRWNDDFQAPNINVNPPNETILNSNTLITINVTDPFLSYVRYRWDSGTEIITDLNLCETFVPIGEGNHILEIWANNSGSSTYLEISYIVDDSPPVLRVIDPLMDSQHRFAPEYLIEVNDPHLDTIFYTVNDSEPVIIQDVSGTINEDLWAELEYGSHYITFYANDTLGQSSSIEILLIKQRFIPGYNFIIQVSVISLLGLILALSRKKKLKLRLNN